uniref:Uncharacterized protein n=1 Tax=Chromera velia CCMP2878 TaxID=1169474 RepID=A0A0G4HSD6_9ALVE|eukprot:Cvel_31012.t1-p1 / transcript=Cvel_31012.t1 / gene=Cvel_31012 / organism=Chromera_velia_CCMP2878 / gene_product=hypothetical protein / transcript_product=hypothetical protein / location=Cvel_scaffold4538:7570-7767(-) / protein_length=66 / sequence_SO=supercontig / SO=protein_coding / is_pseudo=false
MKASTLPEANQAVQSNMFGRIPNGSDFCFVVAGKDHTSGPEGTLKMETSGGRKGFDIYYNRSYKGV